MRWGVYCILCGSDKHPAEHHAVATAKDREPCSPVFCMDGVRKGRVYHFPVSAREFQINTLVPGSAEAAFYGAPLSGYAGFVHKVYTMWGTGVRVAYHDRVTT